MSILAYFAHLACILFDVLNFQGWLVEQILEDSGKDIDNFIRSQSQHDLVGGFPLLLQVVAEADAEVDGARHVRVQHFLEDIVQFRQSLNLLFR